MHGVPLAMHISTDKAPQRVVVNEDMAAVEVVGRKGTVFIVPADEYRALLETMHLLSSPANAERLRSSIASVRAGRVEEHALVDVGSVVGDARPAKKRVVKRTDSATSAAEKAQRGVPPSRAAKSTAR